MRRCRLRRDGAALAADPEARIRPERGPCRALRMGGCRRRAAALDIGAFPMREVEACRARPRPARDIAARCGRSSSTRFARRSARFTLRRRHDACGGRASTAASIVAGKRREPLQRARARAGAGPRRVAAALRGEPDRAARAGARVARARPSAATVWPRARAPPPRKWRRPCVRLPRRRDRRAGRGDARRARADRAPTLDGVARRPRPGISAPGARRHAPAALGAARIAPARRRASRRKPLEKALRGFSAAVRRGARLGRVHRDDGVAPGAEGARQGALRAPCCAGRRRGGWRRGATRAGAAVSPQCRLFLLQALRWVHEAPWTAGRQERAALAERLRSRASSCHRLQTQPRATAPRHRTGATRRRATTCASA